MKANLCAHPQGDAATRQADSGSYQLIMRLDRRRRIRVGALGTFWFPAGVYVYTGRASRNLRARLERHLRSEKNLRWHIDYLLRWATIEKARILPGRAEDECSINLETAGRTRYAFLVQRFGSSDCACPSHLVRLGNERLERPKLAEHDGFPGGK